MKVKLKTIEQLREEFGFNLDGRYYITKFNDMFWRINSSMLKQLGKEIEVEELPYVSNYTHTGINEWKWVWHELWFEKEFKPIVFLDESEFEL